MKMEADCMSHQVRDARRFFRPLAVGGTEGVHLVAGGREDCDPDDVVQRDAFRFWAVVFVLSERGKMAFRRWLTDLGPGSLFVYDRTST